MNYEETNFWGKLYGRGERAEILRRAVCAGSRCGAVLLYSDRTRASHSIWITRATTLHRIALSGEDETSRYTIFRRVNGQTSTELRDNGERLKRAPSILHPMPASDPHLHRTTSRHIITTSSHRLQLRGLRPAGKGALRQQGAVLSNYAIGI